MAEEIRISKLIEDDFVCGSKPLQSFEIYFSYATHSQTGARKGLATYHMIRYSQHPPYFSNLVFE